MKQYKLVDDFSGLKRGTRFTAEQVTKDMIITTIQKTKYMIPKLCCEEITATSTFTPVSSSNNGQPHTTGINFQTTMSPDDAKNLANKMGPATSPDPPTPDPPKPKPVKLKKHEFWLTDMTGGDLPSTGINHIMVKNPDTMWEKHMLEDIPKINKFYVWNPDVLEAMWLAYKHNKKALLVGFPGVGKTSAVNQLAAWLRHPVMRFNGKDGIDQSSFLGYAWATKASMEWKDGLMVQGAQQGYIVLIDEVMKIPSGIQMALQTLYEEDGYIVLDDKPGDYKDKKVIPADTFRFFLTDNARGTGDNFALFPSTQQQDTSTLDRYQVTVDVPYMPQAKEVNMLSLKYPGVAIDVIDDLVTFANMVRTGYSKEEISLTLSPRGLETVCLFLGDVPDVKRCLQMVYLDKLANPVEIEAVERMYTATF